MQNQELAQEILARAKDVHDYVVQMRREFHKYPETGFLETRTSGVIAEELQRMGISAQTNIAKTGIVGSDIVDRSEYRDQVERSKKRSF